MEKQEYKFKKMEILQGTAPGYVWVALHSKEGPIRAFEATREHLLTMSAMMYQIAIRLPSTTGVN